MATTKSSAKLEKPVSYATPALEKGLDVLELLGRQPEGLTKSQIARELNRSVSEIFRMLITLAERGYIAQGAEERFSLTLKLFKLVQEHPPIARLITHALPVMRRLSQATLQSCHLGVFEGGRVAFLAQVDAPTNLGFYVKVGSTADLMEAASGYVLLAHQPEDQRTSMLAEWGRVTGRVVPQDLQAHLSRIRSAGFEKRASYLVKGVVNISFPILDIRGSAVAALTVPFIQHLNSDIGPQAVTAALHAGAREITTSVGGIMA